MDPESKKLLQETLELTKDNNKMLLSMRRSQKISNIMSFVYWIFIIGSAIGAYYFIQPFVDQLKSVYGSASKTLKSFPN